MSNDTITKDSLKSDKRDDTTEPPSTVTTAIVKKPTALEFPTDKDAAPVPSTSHNHHYSNQYQHHHQPSQYSPYPDQYHHGPSLLGPPPLMTGRHQWLSEAPFITARKNATDLRQKKDALRHIQSKRTRMESELAVLNSKFEAFKTDVRNPFELERQSVENDWLNPMHNEIQRYKAQIKTLQNLVRDREYDLEALIPEYNRMAKKWENADILETKFLRDIETLHHEMKKLDVSQQDIERQLLDVDAPIDWSEGTLPISREAVLEHLKAHGLLQVLGLDDYGNPFAIDDVSNASDDGSDDDEE